MAEITSAMKKTMYTEVITKLNEKITELSTKHELFEHVIDLLSELPHYNWTGIYEYNESTEELTLFPHYIGLPTDHIRIPKGKGVCGTAVALNEDIIVSDVRKLENYLACSVGTRSEIVVLLKDSDHIYGQIDVDSDEVNVFTDLDKQQLNKIAAIIVEKVKCL